MVNIKSLFAPPVFEEEERTRIAGLLNVMALTAFALVAGGLAFVPFLESRPVDYALDGGFLLADLAVLALMRSGRLRLAGVLFVLELWLLVALYTVSFGGLHSPGYIGFVIVILVAGLLWGIKLAAAIAGFTVLYGAALAIAESRGLLPPLPPEPSFSINALVTMAVIFIVAIVLLNLAMRSILESLERARRNEHALREANRELQELRSSLEKRVLERTCELEQSNSRLDNANRLMKEHQERLIISEKLASLGRLTAGIAHEINTPLAAVRSALFQLDALAGESKSPAGAAAGAAVHEEIAAETRKLIAMAKTAAEQAAGFVRGIRAQTRDVEGGRKERFNAVAVVQEALLLLSHAMIKAGCAASFEPSAGAVELFGSPGHLSLIVTNLVANSIDGCIPKGGGTISLSLRPCAAGVLLEVADSGIGIPVEHQPRVFDPMFTTKSYGDRAGMGLTIVQETVVGKFGGTISFTSEPGSGARFTVTFPNPAPDA